MIDVDALRELLGALPETRALSFEAGADGRAKLRVGALRVADVADRELWPEGVEFTVPSAEAALYELAREVATAHVNLVAQHDAVVAERDRLARACFEGLPRECLACPQCGTLHIDGADGTEYGRKPHHTHQCHRCNEVWDAERWSFGAREPTHYLASEIARLRSEVASYVGRVAVEVAQNERKRWLAQERKAAPGSIERNTFGLYAKLALVIRNELRARLERADCGARSIAIEDGDDG